MTPLEFKISVKNAEAKDSLQEFHQQIEQIKAEANTLYEGPARESRIRTEIGGIIKDISLGKDPIYVMISSMERLSEAFRFAGIASAGLAVGFGIGEALVKARQGADDLKQSLTEALSVSAENESISELKNDVAKIDDITKKYESQGFLQKFLYGYQIDPLYQEVQRLKDLKTDLAEIQQLADDTRAQEAKRLLASPDPADQLKGRKLEQQLGNEKEEQKVKDDYKGAQKAMEDHQKAMEALEEEHARVRELRAHAHRGLGGLMIDSDFEEQKASLQKLIDSDKEVITNANAELAKTKEAGKAELDKIQRDDDARRLAQQREQNRLELGLELEKSNDKKAILEQRVHEDEIAETTGPASGRATAHTQTVEDKLALAREIDRLQSAAAERTKKIEDLRKETLKAEYDRLEKEEKLIVLRAEQSRLAAELQRMVYSAEARAEMQKELAEVKGAIAELNKHDSILHGINAEEAIRGQMASGVFNRLTNDGANRAEKQRDQMVDYLKKIAEKGDPTQISAF